MRSSSILLVDDDPMAILGMGRLLDGIGHTRFATNGGDALRLARESTPDLVLLDAEMPGMTGFRVCEEMKADPRLVDVPVIFVTSHDDPEYELAGFGIGAVDFITKPVAPERTIARIKAHLQLQHSAGAVRRLLRVDEHTGFANRAGFGEALRREWQRAQRSNEGLSLVLVNVDHYPELLASRGGSEATACMQAVAKLLPHTCARTSDTLAHLDADRFAMLLPLTPRLGAEVVALRVLHAVGRLHIAHPASPTSKQVTVSIGVGSRPVAESSAAGPPAGPPPGTHRFPRRRGDDLLLAAETSLRAARHRGHTQAWSMQVTELDDPSPGREIEMPEPGLYARSIAATCLRLPSAQP